ncbi:Domain of unknown function, putative [Angomonas deanei]|uniref:Cilia- and flagella-associated protein 206 n=1 Tax=Angomonas deanei TaxID=59799 RepID=A0A7G2CQV0_9TRYP|nr:Domain of unknown function, putative [Angomonas deanei]
MDVFPSVAEEIVTRYQLRAAAVSGSAGPSSETLLASTKATTASSAITSDVTLLLARLWLLGSPKTDDAGNVGEEAEKIESLVEEIVDFLLERCSFPTLNALLLLTKTESTKTTMMNARRNVEVKHHAVGIRLVESMAQKKNATPEEILGDITLYILHSFYQLDNRSPDYASIERDAAGVLCTVLPRAQAVAFSKQDPVEKQRQLDELARVVWGIRLFYKESGKSPGVGLVDLPAVLMDPLQTLGELLEDGLARVSDRMRKALATLKAPTCPLSKEERKLLSNEYHHILAIRHMYLHLATSLAALRSRIETVIVSSYTTTLDELAEMFPNSKSNSMQNVPKRVAYPKFVQLADAYAMGLKTLEEFDELRELISLAMNSEGAYTTALPTHFAEEAVDAAQPAPSVARVALAQVAEKMLSSRASLGDYRAHFTTDSPHTLDGAVEEHYPQLLFGLHSFCPVTYSKSELLVEGRLHPEDDPTCPGFVVVEGGSGRLALSKPWCFAFAEESALRAFVQDPLKYFIPPLQKCSRQEPFLSLLLGLSPLLPSELYIAGARSVEKTSLSNVEGLKVDVATQTGQIDSYIDRNYRWNEWDLRRQALKLVNLMNMRTHFLADGGLAL